MTCSTRYFKAYPILISFFFVLSFLIPSAKAGITFQPRYWDKVCSHTETIDGNETGICLDEQFPDITDHLDINWEEVEAGRVYRFYATNRTSSVDLTEFEHLPIQNKTEGIIITNIQYIKPKNELRWQVIFPEGWQNNEKFSLGNHTITYSSSSNLITVVGDATCGNTEANACNFLDIYDVDIANNTWNCTTIGVNSTGSLVNTSFTFDCRLQIGNGSTTTWFRDTEKQVFFSPSAVKANSEDLITVTANANFNLGYLVNAGERTSQGGCSIFAQNTYTYIDYIDADSGSNVNIYDSYFVHTTSALLQNQLQADTGATFRLWHTVMEGIGISGGGDWDIYDIYVYRPRYGIININDEDVNDVTVVAAWGATTFSSYNYDVKFKNIKLYDDSTYKHFYMQKISTNKYIIDTEPDEWTFYFLTTASGDCPSEAVRQNTFNLNILLENGTALSNAIVNINSTSTDPLCFNNATTTGVDGGIGEQTITVGFWNVTAGGSIEQNLNHMYDCNPYVFKIEKSGYETLNFTANITEKTKWTLPMGTGITTQNYTGNYTFIIRQSINVLDYNSTNITYALHLYLFNALDYNITDANVTIEGNITTTSFLINMTSNSSNVTTFSMTFRRPDFQTETDMNITSLANITFNGELYSSNSMWMILPIDPITKMAGGMGFAFIIIFLIIIEGSKRLKIKETGGNDD